MTTDQNTRPGCGYLAPAGVAAYDGHYNTCDGCWAVYTDVLERGARHLGDG